MAIEVGLPLLGSAATVTAQATGGLTTASTTLASLSTPVQTTFVAPPSGKVLVLVQATIACTAAASRLDVGAEVRTGGTFGAGTVVVAADAAGNAMFTVNAVWHPGARTALLTGLTPGATYNTRIMVRLTAAGTGYINDPRLIVTPLVA